MQGRNYTCGYCGRSLARLDDAEGCDQCAHIGMDEGVIPADTATIPLSPGSASRAGA